MSNVKKQYQIVQDGAGLYSVFKMAQNVMNSESENVVEAFSSTEASINILMKKCHNMVKNAKKESTDKAEQSYKSGYDKGYAESFEKSREESAKSAAEKNIPSIKEIDELKNRLAASFNINSGKDKNIEKALELAQNIIETELSENDDAYFGLYKKAANHISSVPSATLVTNEHGKEIYEKNKEKYINAIDGLNELKIKVQSGESGLCVLETELGNVDSSARKQFDRAKNIMMPQN